MPSYVGNPQLVLWKDLPQWGFVFCLIFVAASCVLTAHVGHHPESVPCRTVILVPCAECLEVVEILRCIITTWWIVFGLSSSWCIFLDKTHISIVPPHITFFPPNIFFQKSWNPNFDCFEISRLRLYVLTQNSCNRKKHKVSSLETFTTSITPIRTNLCFNQLTRSHWNLFFVETFPPKQPTPCVPIGIGTTQCHLGSRPSTLDNPSLKRICSRQFWLPGDLVADSGMGWLGWEGWWRRVFILWSLVFLFFFV